MPTQSDRIGETGSFGGCADFFASLDKQTKKANVIDPGAFPNVRTCLGNPVPRKL